MSRKCVHAVRVQIVVLWAVTSCNPVAGYQRFGGTCCLSSTLKIEAT
jgi:hypothetical protein